MITVICPTYNEVKYISDCLDSIIQCDFPKDKLEVLIIDGMSSDATRSIVKEYARNHSFIILLDNTSRTVPYALNIGIGKAKGDIIVRIDAHTYYPKNYFSILTNWLHSAHADCVGAICRTDVKNITFKSTAIKTVLSNKLGVGNSVFRTCELSEAMEVDTVPFGCWPKATFEKYGLFDERLTRNQDIEFNKRIKRGGGKVLLVPGTYSTYYARETFLSLARNNFSNGKWNVLTIFYTKEFNSLSLRHYIPLFFMLSLIVPLLGAFIYPPIGLIAIGSLLSYLITIFVVSYKEARSTLNIFLLIWAFIVLHFSYGFGSFMGIISVLGHFCKVKSK